MPRAKPANHATASSASNAVSAAIVGISPENTNEALRSASFKNLLRLAGTSPAAVFPHWNDLTRLLESKKAFSRFPAVHIIAALVPADRQSRFERIFNRYFALLDDEAISVAAHVARLAGGIAKAKPALQAKITKRLLAIDQTHFDAGRRDLVKSYALQAFDEYLQGIPNRRAILAFAASLRLSKSPKARTVAKAFLATWSA